MIKALLSLWVSYVALAFITMDVDLFGWEPPLRFCMLVLAVFIFIFNNEFKFITHEDNTPPKRITPTLGDNNE